MTTSSTRSTPKCAGTAVRSPVSGPRPSSARTAHHSASPPSWPPPPQSPLISPRARNRVVSPPGATPTQLIPAPQTTPTPQCAPESSRPARSTANVSLTTDTVVRPALTRDQLAQLGFLVGQVGARQAGRRVRGDRPVRRHARPRGRGPDQIGQHRDHPVPADALMIGPAAADRGKHAAVGGDERHIGLAVAAVDRQNRGGLRHRFAQGRNAAFSASRRSVSFWARSYWPDDRVREQRLGHPVAAAVHSGRRRPVPRTPTRARSARSSAGPAGPRPPARRRRRPRWPRPRSPPGQLRNGSVPLLRTFTTWRSRASVSSDASSATAASE